MLLIGIDEAGRGTWAGPVTAAAVAADEGEIFPRGTRDSKKMSARQRSDLYEQLCSKFIFGIGSTSAEDIDKLGIVEATRLAMEQALKAVLSQIPERSRDGTKILVDGKSIFKNKTPTWTFVVKGEDKYPTIAAASIIAKVTRDLHMCELAEKFPLYGLEVHKGYGTQAHHQALLKHGPVAKLHRMTFSPIRALSLAS